MAGLGFDDAMPSFIDAKTHAIIDYVHAGTNFIVGALFWKRNRRAAIGALSLGAGVLANALMTDYPLGVYRLYDFKVHGMLDYGVAATSAALPPLLGIHNTPQAKFFYIQGVAEAGTAGVSDYTDNSGSKRLERHVDRWRKGRAA